MNKRNVFFFIYVRWTFLSSTFWIFPPYRWFICSPHCANVSFPEPIERKEKKMKFVVWNLIFIYLLLFSERYQCENHKKRAGTPIISDYYPGENIIFYGSHVKHHVHSLLDVSMSAIPAITFSFFCSFFYNILFRTHLFSSLFSVISSVTIKSLYIR